MYIPYLTFGCDSVDFNVERVSGYLKNLCDVCGSPDAFRLVGTLKSDCQPLSWDAYTTNLDNPAQSIPLRYTTPSGVPVGSPITITGATYQGSGLIDFTATNTFEVGQIVSISGFKPLYDWINVDHFVVDTATATGFSGYLACKLCTPSDPVVTTPIGTVISMSGSTPVVTAHEESPAPWYDGDVDASGRFLGYIIEEFTGLESPAKREIVPKMSGSGGGVFGPYHNNPRQFQITALMFACDQEAMDYGFRYLKDALGYWACSKCETCDMTFTTACQSFDMFAAGYYQPPSQDEVLRTRWNAYSVGLVEGPTYAEAPIPRVACNIRRVQFVIASEDPWLYECETDEGTFDLGLTGLSATDNNALDSGVVLTATVTALTSDGTNVVYSATNGFRTGDIVTVEGLTPVEYNVTNSVVVSATTSTFTLESTVTGPASIPPNGTATLVARGFEHVQPIVSSTNIGELALNVTIDNPSSLPTYDVSISLYPDNLGYKYWEWQGITGTTGYATSATSVTLAYGSASLTTTAPSGGWSINGRLRCVSATSNDLYIEGLVTSYTAPVLTIDVDTIGGVIGSSNASWKIGKPIPANWESPDACARVVVSTIPAGYTFTINSARETYTLTSDGGEEYDGTPYVTVEPGTIPEFLSARCGTYALGVSASYTDVGTGTTYTVESQHREL